MEAILSIMMGVALSATCGFRVFVPLLAVSIGTRAQDANGQPLIELAGGFDWLSSDIALMVFVVATLFEIGGYYIPWIDNLLDTIASPASIVAGTVITASFITGMDPWLQWLLGVVAGGGAAGAVQATTVVARAGSTVTTGGLGNPIVASVETSGAFLGSALSIVAVKFAIVVFVLVLGGGIWIWCRRHKLAEAH
ncbi:MAG: DUF4126 domain-containing protein [Verrucomicrobia bacterium]|mgnify:CR=1 FL=1|jgi:hypothetical protein|nr:DUF4126 domain-containing protein [Verrucomicrobiota bacterium]MBT3841977.1 DUF4126 domain-containing protein [Verrucomicrobiota bacterium]MBT3913566.1 DUF4126 domain-containing protein [Verrucomicrobiota bacterium]MBT4902907.1 DUF4126 domain-containing protein [Verrucomicrobiota bacterium]MBT5621365.1 DUF4126 domain-containing protein [Verrucomicrobiota bacterium]